MTVTVTLHVHVLPFAHRMPHDGLCTLVCGFVCFLDFKKVYQSITDDNQAEGLIMLKSILSSSEKEVPEHAKQAKGMV